MNPRIPISVLTGFLGTGKTTALKHLALANNLSRTLVLVNEYGEVGLDHHLLTPIDDDILVALSSGCICCSIRSDLAQVLVEAPRRYSKDGVKRFDRVIIETTGIADPAPILQTILGDEQVAKAYYLASVITVVDAVNGISTLKNHPEAVKQAAVADRILLSKTDLAAENVKDLEKTILGFAPSVPISQIFDGSIDCDWFFGDSIYSVENKPSYILDWLGRANPKQEMDLYISDNLSVNKSRHSTIVASHLVFEEPVDAALFETCLQMLLDFRGADLLRVKGIVNVAGMDLPMVIHGVQHIFHPPEILEGWPDEDRSTRIAIIARDLQHEQIASCFNGFGIPTDQ
jgi:G3E family GTPase